MNTMKFTEEGLFIPYPPITHPSGWEYDKQTLTDAIAPIESYWSRVKNAIQRGTYRWINSKNAELYQEWENHLLNTSTNAATFWNEFIIDILPIFRRMIISSDMPDSSKLVALNHLSEWELFVSAR